MRVYGDTVRTHAGSSEGKDTERERDGEKGKGEGRHAPVSLVAACYNAPSSRTGRTFRRTVIQSSTSVPHVSVAPLSLSLYLFILCLSLSLSPPSSLVLRVDTVTSAPRDVPRRDPTDPTTGSETTGTGTKDTEEEEERCSECRCRRVSLNRTHSRDIPGDTYFSLLCVCV